MGMASSLVAAATDLVLPRSCVECGAPGEALCASCAGVASPLTIRSPSIDIMAAGWYTDGLRTAVLAYKERGCGQLAAPLGRLLARAVLGAASDRRCCVIPVPSSATAIRRRGGDHMRRLARLAARELGYPLSRPLALVRPVRDSVGLGAGDRRVNVTNSMRAHPPPEFGPRRAIVVDDIVTSAATVSEAVRALRLAGWECPVASVIAATPRTAAVPSVRSAGERDGGRAVLGVSAG
jgi:predicted amidophosphoribosyltransferase